MTSSQTASDGLLATGDLLVRARQSDSEAIELLFGRYQHVLQGFLHKRLPVCQEMRRAGFKA
jgi:hypothetical protein